MINVSKVEEIWIRKSLTVNAFNFSRHSVYLGNVTIVKEVPSLAPPKTLIAGGGVSAVSRGPLKKFFLLRIIV